MNEHLSIGYSAACQFLVDRGIGQTPWSLIRITVWTVLLLALAGRTSLVPVPGPVEVQGGVAAARIDMPAPFGDPRGFERPAVKRTGGLRVAWIGDSSSQFRAANGEDGPYLPEAVLGQLAAGADEPRPVAFSYVLNGQRPYDSYVCLLDALEQEPDAIVITLNPVWSFERRSLIFRRHLLRSAGHNLPGRLTDVAWYAAMAEPATWANALLSPVFPSLHYRRTWHERIAHAARFVQRDYGAPGKMSETIDAWRRAHQPVAYTVYPAVFLHDAYMHYGHTGDALLSRTVYAAQQMRVLGTAAERVVRLLIDRAAGAGIPTVVYRSPINPDFLRDPAFAAQYLREWELLETLAGENASSSVRIVPALPPHAIEALEFADYTHIFDGPQNAPYIGLIAAELQGALADMLEGEGGRQCARN